MSEEADVYGTWLSRYSPDRRDPIEALFNVRKEVEDLLKGGVPLEVRVAALERYIMTWTEFMLSMFFVDEVQKQVGSEFLVDRATAIAEFLHLASLAEAIKLSRLANEGENG